LEPELAFYILRPKLNYLLGVVSTNAFYSTFISKSSIKSKSDEAVAAKLMENSQTGDTSKKVSFLPNYSSNTKGVFKGI
jgi:hypothetical protein